MKFTPGDNDYPPSNALEFIQWLQDKIDGLPCEARKYVTIDFTIHEHYEDYAVTVEINRHLPPPDAIPKENPILRLPESERQKLTSGDFHVLDSGSVSIPERKKEITILPTLEERLTEEYQRNLSHDERIGIYNEAIKSMQPAPNENLDKIVTTLLELSEDERLDVFSNFCKSCGIDDPRCQCWNDE